MTDERRLTPLGVWIEQYLEQHRMSLRELAGRMEYSHAQISRVKFGDSKPSTNFIRKLAYATGATENELLIIAFGQIRYEAARANARRIMESSSGVQEALRGIAIYLSQLPPRDQLTVIELVRMLANMPEINRAKALREITAYLENRN